MSSAVHQPAAQARWSLALHPSLQSNVCGRTSPPGRLIPLLQRGQGLRIYSTIIECFLGREWLRSFKIFRKGRLRRAVGCQHPLESGLLVSSRMMLRCMARHTCPGCWVIMSAHRKTRRGLCCRACQPCNVVTFVQKDTAMLADNTLHRLRYTSRGKTRRVCMVVTSLRLCSWDQLPILAQEPQRS